MDCLNEKVLLCLNNIRNSELTKTKLELVNRPETRLFSAEFEKSIGGNRVRKTIIIRSYFLENCKSFFVKFRKFSDVFKLCF